MATFGAVKTAIARRLLDVGHTAVTEAEIATAINDAIRKWKGKRFWFNTTSFDLVLAAGDFVLTLPTDFLIDLPRNAVTIVQDGYTYKVEKVSTTVFDGYKTTQATGRPDKYTNRDGVLQILPTTDIAYSGKLYYQKDYTAFSTTTSADDASTNDFLDEGLTLIQNQALADLHGELRQDDKMEDRYIKKTQEEYNTLRTRTALTLRTGTLTVEQGD